MARDGNDTLIRSWALFVGAIGLALAPVLPLLLGKAAEGGVPGVALVALVAAVLLTCRRRCVPLAVREACCIRAGGPPAPHTPLSGHVTDPPHHPLRPRAPGPA